jgi:hypothetical protein
MLFEYRFGRDYKRSRVNLGEAKLKLIFSWLAELIVNELSQLLDLGEN